MFIKLYLNMKFHGNTCNGFWNRAIVEKGKSLNTARSERRLILKNKEKILLLIYWIWTLIKITALNFEIGLLIKWWWRYLLLLVVSLFRWGTLSLFFNTLIFFFWSSWAGSELLLVNLHFYMDFLNIFVSFSWVCFVSNYGTKLW